MINIPSLRPETRYGIPPADQYLFNRQFIIGYSYLFRQPRWSLQMINLQSLTNRIDDRLDNFREDLRLPVSFRSTLDDYRNSGFDRGHLVPSADKRAEHVINSESFLLSNMSPQYHNMNAGPWKTLEEKTRELCKNPKYVEIYVLSGPVFEVGKPIDSIGDDLEDDKDNFIPVPHAFFKSILAEKRTGKFSLWSFLIPNIPEADEDTSFKDYRILTSMLELKVGLPMWDRISGKDIQRLKDRRSKLWFGE